MSMRVATLAVTVALAAVTVAAFDAVRITGGSMRPALEPGEVVLVARWIEPVVGDVVLVRDSDGTQFVHRVVGLQGEDLVTRGDANDSCDLDPVSLERIVGKVVTSWRLGARPGVENPDERAFPRTPPSEMRSRGR